MPIDHDFRLAVDRALSRLFRTGGMIKVFRGSFDPEAKPSELLKALSLLYRGALVTLLHRDGVELASGDTEEDCLRKSRSHISEGSLAYFARLLDTWQRLAYARREVARTEVETLCSDWRAHFAGAQPGAAGQVAEAIRRALDRYFD